MFIEKNNCRIFYSIKNTAENYLEKLCDAWDIYDKQRFFVNAVSIYDRLFLDLNIYRDNTTEQPFSYRIIDLSYPVFINNFYDCGFQNLPGIVLKPMDEELLKLYSKILYSCGIIGWMQSLIDDVNSKYVSYYSLGNYVRMRFNHKYHWNEYLEKEYILWYSNIVADFHKSKYEELNKKFPEINNKMKSQVFIWMDSFIGYSNDEEVEEYFSELALLDAQEATEWDMFPQDCKFGNLYYRDIVQTIVDFAGYSIKHTYFSSILKSKKPDLIYENLLINITTEDDLIKLIRENLFINAKESENLLNTISLINDNKTYYLNAKAARAPLIKVSNKQYIRSISGFLDRPFEFVLNNLLKMFPKDWSKNTNQREFVFRKQLYDFFDDDKYICVDRPVIIKDKTGKTITDIDALVVDKINHQIAMFQLKWQDHTNDSVFILKSKMENYNNKAEKWVADVYNWLKSSPTEEIARQLNIKRKHVEKDKIFMFVIGRRHGNYSANKKPKSNCAWAQWYQVMQISTYLKQNDMFSISDMYQHLKWMHPSNRKIIEKKTVFKYDKYKIHIGGII